MQMSSPSSETDNLLKPKSSQGRVWLYLSLAALCVLLATAVLVMAAMGSKSYVSLPMGLVQRQVQKPVQLSRFVLYESADAMIDMSGPDSVTHVIVLSLHFKQDAKQESSYMAYVNDMVADDDGWNVVKRKIALASKSGSKKVLLMLSATESTDAVSLTKMFDAPNDYLPSLVAAIESWGVDGLDIDVRDESVSQKDLASLNVLLSSLRAHFGDAFLLTLSINVESVVTNADATDVAAATHYLDWMNVHLMIDDEQSVHFWAAQLATIDYPQDKIVTVLSYPQGGNVDPDFDVESSNALQEQYGYADLGIYYPYWNVDSDYICFCTFCHIASVGTCCKTDCGASPPTQPPQCMI